MQIKSKSLLLGSSMAVTAEIKGGAHLMIANQAAQVRG
jgi:hypothetical protein